MFDPQCLELAWLFISTQPEQRRTKAHAEALAQVIQDAIESHLNDLESAASSPSQEPRP